MKERSRRIDLRIREAQESVAILRSQSLSSSVLPTGEGVSESSTSVENLCPFDTDNDIIDGLRIRIHAQEAELESLRMERMRMQQVIDTMDNEALPEYEEECVARILQ